MRKKFLSVCLLGAVTLATTSTFVSCKDYDDDITSLQEQITSLQTALGEKVTSANSAVEALKGEVATLKAQLANCATKEEAANLAAAIKSLEDAQKKLEAAMNDYATKKYVDDAVASINVDKAISEAIAKVNAAIAVTDGNVKTVTENLQKVSDKLNDVDKKYSTLPADVKKLQDQIAKLQAALDAQIAACDCPKAVKDGDAATLAEAKKAIADAKAEIEAAQKKVDEAINAAVKKAQDAADAANGDIATLKSELAKAASKSEVDEISKQITTIVNETIPAVESKIAAYDAKIEVMTKVLANKLRSMVFIPGLYVDGIEAIEYAYAVDSTLVKKDIPAVTRDARGTLPDQRVETGTRKLDKLSDYVLKTPIEEFWICPNWGVDYHMNPSTSTTEYKDIKGFNVIEAKSITRANIANDGKQITSPEKYLDGTQLFGNGVCGAGILTAGININEASLKKILDKTDGNGPAHIDQDGDSNFCDGQTGDVSYGKENLVALQAQSRLVADKDTFITSDYAMIYPEKIGIEGLIWDKYPGKIKIQNAPGHDGFATVGKSKGDEKGNEPGKTVGPQQTPSHWGANGCDKEIHVWNNPVEALLYSDPSNLVEVVWNDEKGVELQKYLGIHVVRETVESKVKKENPTLEKVPFTKATPKQTDHNALTLGRLGLTYSFELVDYNVNDVTFDSRYAKIDAATGTIVAGNVDAKGNHVDDMAETSIDREPLVRVLVKYGEKVILDGYILCHICREPVVTPPEPDHKIELEKRSVEFDLCNGKRIYTLNWSEWSKWILTDDMKIDGKSMTKEEFTKYYAPDGTISAGPDSENTVWYTMKLYKAAGSAVAMTGLVNDDAQWGEVTVQWNEAGVQNHEIEWNMTEPGLEYNSHDGKNGKEVWICFKRTADGEGKVKYPNVWMKMSVDITRKPYEWKSLTNKNFTYWFNAWEGNQAKNDNEAEGFILNNKNPLNNNTLRDDDATFSRQILTAFDGNKMTTSNVKNTSNATLSLGAPKYNTQKFFFLPVDIKVKDFTIKAQAEAVCPYDNSACPVTYLPEDTKYDRLYCKYHQHVSDVTKCICDKHAPMTVTGTPWQTKNYHQHTATDKICNCKDFHALGLKSYADYRKGTFAEMKADIEKKFNDILASCAIDYDKGVFMNNVLVVDGTIIARLNQASGQIDLVYNDVTKKVLNAIGWYNDNRTNIDEEMRALVAVARPNDCGVVMQATDNIFQISWERPLNIKEVSKHAIDAKTNGNVIYLGELIDVFDFRGPVHGNMMEEGTIWQWAFYNIDAITVNCDGVLTDQDNPGNWVKWQDRVSVLGELYSEVLFNKDGEPYRGYQQGSYTYKIDGTGPSGFNIYDYDCADKSKDLYDILNDAPGTHVVTKGGKYYDLKAALGAIFYDNNGTNVHDFNIKVPITLHYYWGYFSTYVTINIKGTLGNND